MKKTIALFFFVIFCYSLWASCHLPQRNELLQLENCGAYFIDSTQLMSPTTIENQFFITKELPATSNHLDLWVKYSISNQTQADFYYQLTAGNIGRAAVYAKVAGQYILMGQNGFLLPPQKRKDQNTPQAVVFSIPAATTTLLFKFTNFNSYNHPIAIQPTLRAYQPTANPPQRNRSFWYGITLGGMLAFILYPLSLLRMERRVDYLYYIVFILFCFLYSLLDTEQNIGIDVLFSYYPTTFIQFNSLFSALSITFYILFFSSFLRLAKRLPALDRLLKYLVYALLASIVADVLLNIFGDSTLAFYQSLIVRGIAFILGIYSIWRVSKLKNRQANYIIAGTTVWLTGTFVFIVTDSSTATPLF
ncbi:MAG: 7TM-DISM domain-containing protein [Saprospiraceae bacterium]